MIGSYLFTFCWVVFKNCVLRIHDYMNETTAIEPNVCIKLSMLIPPSPPCVHYRHHSTNKWTECTLYTTSLYNLYNSWNNVYTKYITLKLIEQFVQFMNKIYTKYIPSKVLHVIEQCVHYIHHSTICTNCCIYILIKYNVFSFKSPIIKAVIKIQTLWYQM